MDIVEKFVQGKDSKTCGDLILINKDFISVIDISTSKSVKSFSSTPYINTYKKIISDTLSEVDAKSDPGLLFSAISKAIYNSYAASRVEDYLIDHPMDRFSASMIVYSNYHNEVWSVGDCQCRYDHKNYTQHKKIDVFLSEIRSTFLEMEILHGKSVEALLINDTGRDYIYPLLCNQYLYQANSQHRFSYRVVDGFDIPNKFIKRFKILGDTLIMASDGYPLLFDTLSETESYLNVQLKEDPLFIGKHKSTKGYYPGNQSFDDRAYIKIKV